MSIYAILIQKFGNVMRVLDDLSQNLRSGVALTFFLPISRSSFVISVDQLVVLLLFNFVIATLFSYIRIESAATFNYWQFSALGLHVLLVLFASFLVSRLHGQDDWALSFPLIIASTYLPYEMIYSTYNLLSRKEIVQMGVAGIAVLPYLGLIWIGSVLLFFFSRILGLQMSKLVLSLALFSSIVFVPRYYFPVGELWWSNAENADHFTESNVDSVTKENIFYAQAGMLPKELALLQPGQPNQTDLYFLGVAPYASQDVFVKEIRAVRDIFRSRFYAEGRALTLVNHHTTLQTFPIASITSLRMALQRIGSAMNREEDILFLYITTHGSRTHELSVEFYPLELSAITPLALKTALAESNIKWKVVVISACYAGGFVEPLKDDYTAVITAADATHTSFGCGDQFDFTYFGEAFFDQQLQQTYSFTEAFNQARLTIAKRETSESLTPSNPQLYVSEVMKTKLQHYENELSTRAKNTVTLATAR